MKPTAFPRQFGVVLLAIALLGLGSVDIHAQSCAVDAPEATGPLTYSGIALISSGNPVYDKVLVSDGTGLYLHHANDLTSASTDASALGASAVALSRAFNLGIASTPDWANFNSTSNTRDTLSAKF